MNKFEVLKKLILARWKLHDSQNDILKLIDKAYQDKDINTVENIELYNYYSCLRQYGETGDYFALTNKIKS